MITASYRINWISALATIFGAAVIFPSMFALAITLFSIAVHLF